MSLKACGIGLASLLGIWMVYAPVLRHGFVYEDDRTVQQMTSGHQLALWPPSGRMVTSLSYAILPADAPTQHAAGVWLHLTMGALVALLAHRLGVSAWLAAGLFLAHPLAVQAVAYTAQRSELLAGVGVLGAVACAMSRQTVWTVAGIVACATIGLLAKESAIVVALLIPLCWWRQPVAWWAWGCLGAVLLVAAVAFAPRVLALNAMTSATALDWARWQTTAVWRELVFWPLGQAVEHHPQAVARVWQDVALWSWGLVGVSAGLAMWRTWRIGFGLAWVWLAVLPRLLVQTPSSVLAEHQLYVAVVGVAIGLAEVINGA